MSRLDPNDEKQITHECGRVSSQVFLRLFGLEEHVSFYYPHPLAQHMLAFVRRISNSNAVIMVPQLSAGNKLHYEIYH